VRVWHGLLVIFISLIALGIWTGLGYGVAWVLDAGLSVNVNYKVFVIVGFVIGVIKSLFILLVGVFQNRMLKDF
jgi:phosphoglycerate-specific signal transduction histidine kinase